MDKRILFLITLLLGTFAIPTFAQKEGKVKISGYLQADLELGQKDTKFKVAHNTTTDNFRTAYGIRRGRLKVAYKKDFYKGVFQLDMSEKKIDIRNAYIELFSKEGLFGRSALRCGVFDTPFGYEVEYSSSKRESPERAKVITSLFPNEIEVGAMLNLRTNKQSLLKDCALKLALVGGEGVKNDVRKENPVTDNRFNFISHLTYQKQLSGFFKFSGGVSTYLAKEYQLYGFDTQMFLRTNIGLTKLKGEFIHGTEAKNVQGGYAMLVQSIKNLPVSAVLKYDWYDPNVKAGDDFMSSLGFGMLYHINKHLRVQAYYTKHMEEVELANDIFNLQLQLSF